MTERLAADISKMDNATNTRVNIHSDARGYTLKHPFHQKQNKQKLQKFFPSPKQGLRDQGGEN